jgi:hypothetical protein
MPDYTICPKFIEYAGNNKKFINDVLMNFVPDNSKVICIDEDEKILSEYQKIIDKDKDLSDWLRFLTMSKESNFKKVKISRSIQNIILSISNNTYDKTIITDDLNKYSEHKQYIIDNKISLIDKNLAKVHLNYGNVNFPITKSLTNTIITKENVYSVVKKICLEFKDLIENKGLYKLLVQKNDERVSEKKAQLLFFGVAYCYCSANDLKLSPEVNSGNGPVDFNLSKGFKANVNVEMKISDSNKLENGLWSQLNIYNKAENTDRSIYIIVKTNQNQSEKIDKLINVVNYRVSKGEKIPEILVIDSTYKESASVRK